MSDRVTRLNPRATVGDTSGGSGAPALTRTARTGTFTAGANQLNALDTTGGTFVGTIPAAATAGKCRIVFKWIAGTTAPTLALTGSDKINNTSTTPPTFQFLNQGFTYESDGVGTWSLTSDDLPLDKLDYRYTEGGLPSYAPMGLTQQYNPDLCAYGLGPAQMAPQRIAAGKALAGLGSFNWLHLGDSVSCGYFGSTAARPNDPSLAWPYIARDIMLASGMPWGGTGYVSPCQNLDPAGAGDDYDPRWTLSSGWNTHNYGLYAYATAAGEVGTLTVPAEYGGCTDVAWVVDDAFADCTYVVKNSAGATIASGDNAATGGSTIRIIHLSGLTDVRSVSFTSPAGTSSSHKARINPANIWKAGGGLQVHNLSFVAVLGSGVNGWENTGAVYNGCDKIAQLCVPTPDLLTALLGGNDEFYSYAATPTATGIGNVFAKWGSSAGTKIFFGHSQAGSWDANHMATYLAAYWTMCEANGIGWVDQYALSGGYTLMNAMGLMQDATGGQTHPNQAFAQMVGRQAALLFTVPISQESIQDLLAATLVEGSNVTISYNDATGQVTISATGGGGGGGGSAVLTSAPPWAGATVYAANTYAQLPTGGLGFRTSSGTSRATWDATERAAWTFIPGGHYEVYGSSVAGFTGPPGITQVRGRCCGTGGAGGGAGSASSAIAQGAAGGGGAAAPCDFEAAVTAGTTYTLSVGAAISSGGLGGASGGNAGVTGANGNDTSITIGSVTYTSKGGGGGAKSSANSTSEGGGGAYGFAGLTQAFGALYPGYGGTGGIGAVPLGSLCGGAGGAGSTTTLGGLGGTSRQASAPGAGIPNPTGNTGTTTGGAGETATQPGCGGGGGGGGANGGAGGAGGGVAAGTFEVWF